MISYLNNSFGVTYVFIELKMPLLRFCSNDPMAIVVGMICVGLVYDLMCAYVKEWWYLLSDIIESWSVEILEF